MDDYPIDKALESVKNLIDIDAKKREDKMDNESVIEGKIREEMKALQIDNDRMLGRLVEKRLVKAVLEDVAQSIVKTFADLPRPQAVEIATTFNMSDKTDAIEKILARNIVNSLNEVSKEITKEIKYYA